MSSTPSKSRFMRWNYHLLEKASQDPYNEEASIKSLLAESDTSSDTEHVPHQCHCGGTPQRSVGRLFMGLNIALFCFSAFLLSISGYQVFQSGDKFKNDIWRKTSMPSPIFDKVHIPVVDVQRNGSFSPRNPPSIWRQDPSPEVDAAWERISNINTIPISTEDVIARGVDPSQTARYPDEQFGFGPDAHIARLDVTHQLHCLNALRKNIYPNFGYYWGGKFQDDIPSPSHKAHVTHCIEIIMQHLMCTATTDPILHYWVDISEEPFPNFDDTHKCRDFDTILDWQMKNSIDMGSFREKIRKPRDERGVGIEKKMSKAYKYMMSQNQIADHTYTET